MGFSCGPFDYICTLFSISAYLVQRARWDRRIPQKKAWEKIAWIVGREEQVLRCARAFQGGCSSIGVDRFTVFSLYPPRRLREFCRLVTLTFFEFNLRRCSSGICSRRIISMRHKSLVGSFQSTLNKRYSLFWLKWWESRFHGKMSLLRCFCTKYRFHSLISIPCYLSRTNLFVMPWFDSQIHSHSEAYMGL